MSAMEQKPGPGRPRAFDYEQARHLRAEGVGLRELANRFGVAVGSVHRAVCDIPVSLRRGPKPGHSKIDLAVMREMLSAGKPYAEVAQRFGVTRERARQVANKNGLRSRCAWKG